MQKLKKLWRSQSNAFVDAKMYGEMVRVATIGCVFGDESIKTDAPERASTAITRQGAVLLSLTKLDFQRINKDESENSSHREDVTSLRTQQHLHFLMDPTTPIFSVFKQSIASSLLEHFEPLTFTKGDLIYKQGDVLDYMHLIVEGTVTITRTVTVIPTKEGVVRAKEALSVPTRSVQTFEIEEKEVSLSCARFSRSGRVLLEHSA